MKPREKFFELPAVRGIQAGKPYYSVMCPLHMVASFFTYTDNTLPPEMRVQRILNKQRIPEMKEYILQNRDCYVFSAMTASVDGELEFVPYRNSSSGQLKIPMNSRIIVNDGQHRKAAIESALLECPELRYEDISIVIYYDLGLSRSQQMFTDLNRYAVRPTKSLNILYDNRDSFSILIKECITHITIFNGSVENEKSSISNRSRALFTLSGIFHATRLLLQSNQTPDEKTGEVIVSYWNAVASNMKIWQLAKNREISADDFRKDFICAHTIALKALGILGSMLLNQKVDSLFWNDKLKFLQNVNWSKDSKELQGLVIVDGYISSSRNNEKAFANYLIKKSGWMGEPRKDTK